MACTVTAPVRGILGDSFDGLRSGRLDWDEVDTEVREALSQMIEGAILAGMEPPPQARRTEEPPEEPGPAQHVVPQGLASQPGEFAGNRIVPPTVREARPNATPSGRRLGGADQSPIEECLCLHSLRIGLEEQLRLGGEEKRLDSFYLAKAKVNLLLEQKFGVSRQGNLPLSRKSSIELSHRWIKSRERAERQLDEGILGTSEEVLGRMLRVDEHGSGNQAGGRKEVDTYLRRTRAGNPQSGSRLLRIGLILMPRAIDSVICTVIGIPSENSGRVRQGRRAWRIDFIPFYTSQL